MNQLEIMEMVDDLDLRVMQRFIETLFQIMLKNEKILLLITQMDGNHQLQIKEFLDVMNMEEVKNDLPSPTKF